MEKKLNILIVDGDVSEAEELENELNREFDIVGSSILRSWLYLATRSLRLGAPVLVWQVFRATARSAIVVSSVSPER